MLCWSVVWGGVQWPSVYAPVFLFTFTSQEHKVPQSLSWICQSETILCFLFQHSEQVNQTHSAADTTVSTHWFNWCETAGVQPATSSSVMPLDSFCSRRMRLMKQVRLSWFRPVPCFYKVELEEEIWTDCERGWGCRVCCWVDQSDNLPLHPQFYRLRTKNSFVGAECLFFLKATLTTLGNKVKVLVEMEMRMMISGEEEVKPFPGSLLVAW